MNAWKQGDRVLGRWKGGPFWFAGRVDSVTGNGVAVNYDDRTSENLPLEDVRPFDWTVGSKVEAIWSGNGQYYLARITEARADESAFKVRFEDDGIREEVPSGYIRSFL